MTVVEILTVILIVLASAVCIAVIIYMAKITSSIKLMLGHLDQISSEISPLVSSVTQLADRLSETTEEVNDQLQVSKSIVLNIRDRVDTILELEEKAREGIEQPILSLSKNLKAISTGVAAFLNYFKK